MLYVEIPSAVRPLPFYLAAEEYVAAKGSRGEEYFFMWQVEPTVICGRNQVIEKEVNLSFCRSHGVDVCRRRSGGGAVVADRNNIMFSFISLRDSGDVSVTFSHYTSAVAGFLKSLGLSAGVDGRNDILVDGLKVSGYSFYRKPGADIIHGTLLWDMDPVLMSGVLTPSRSKLASSGVKSVESRVTVLRPRLPHLDIEEFMRLARRSLCGTGSVVLSDSAIREIETSLMPPYLEKSWLGRISDRVRSSRRIAGAGEFDAVVVCRGGVIADVSLSGDFFLCGDLDALLSRLRGVECTASAIRESLRDIDVSSVIMNLSTTDFIRMLTENHNIK